MSGASGSAFEEAIDLDGAERAGRLLGPHRDPFDRVLIAQAQARNLPIVSKDSVLDRCGVQHLVTSPLWQEDPLAVR